MMKKVATLLTLSLIVGVYSSRAQTSTNLFWDVNGTTSGIGGTGNWTTTGTTWTTSSAGTATTISGAWTNSATWTNNNANNAILQGTAGTLSLSSGTIFANQIQVNTTGFTIQNSSTGGTGNNRYFRTKNGIVLANGVNLNISAGVTTNGAITGFEGPIVGANGTNSVSTGSSVTIVGATAGAETSIRVALDTSATDVWVPIVVSTTGSGYANISISSSSVTSSLYGDVTVTSGSRLVIGGNNSSTQRRINVRGNLSTVNTDLTIGETGGGSIVVMYGTNNSIGGNVVVTSGALGFGSTNAFGTSTVVLNNGTVFGATSFGTAASDRTLSNKLSVLGNVTFGLNGQYGFTSGAGSYLGGNMDLNNATRTFTITNTTYLQGAVTNGGINLNAGSSSVTTFFNGTNTLTSLTWTNGVVALGTGTKSIGTLTMSNTSGTNAAPSLALDYGVTPGLSTGGNVIFAGTNNTITLTNSVTSTALGAGTYTLLSANSIDVSGLNTNGLVLTGGAVSNARVVLNSTIPVVMPDRTTYQFTNTPTSLQLVVGTSSALDLTWGGGNGDWNTTSQNWNNAGSPINFNSGDNATISSGGTLALDASGIAAGLVTISGDSAATTLTGGNLTAVSFTKTGTASLTLNVTGNYTQGLIVDGGSVDVGSTTQNTTILSVTNGSILGSGSISATSVTLAPAAGSNNTISAALSGSYSLNKNGAGTTTLSGANTFNGDININAGTLATSGNEKLPDTAVAILGSGATLRLGGNETLKAINASQAAAAMVDLQSYTLTLNVTASNSYGSAIMGNGGSLVKNGASILTINETNTFTGGTILNDGAFRLQSSGNRATNGTDVTLTSSPFGTGTLTLNGGRVFSSGTSGRTVYNDVKISGNFSIGDSSTNQNGDITFSTNVNTPAKTTVLTTNAVITTLSLADWEQPVAGANFALTKAGTNRLVLRGANTLSNLTIQAGRLDLRGVNTLGSGQVDVQSGASLGWGTTNGVLGSSVINLSNGAALGQVADMGTTLDDRKLPNAINAAGDFTLGLGGFATHLSGNINLNGGVRKVSLTNTSYLYGSVTNGGLSVDALTYTNAAPVSRTLHLYASNDLASGITLTSTNSATNRTLLVLAVANNQALGSGSLTFAANPSATLRAIVDNRSLANNIVISNGITAIFEAGTNGVVSNDQTATNTVNSDMTLSGAISGGGALVKTNTGTLTLSGALTYTGGTTVSEGALVVSRPTFTATITTNTVAISYSAAPSLGTNSILPGALIGTYPSNSILVTGLGAGRVAEFQTNSGNLIVSLIPAPSGLSYSPSSVSGTNGVAIANLVPSVTGTVTNYSVSPTLPSGLGINPTTGVISGTPSAPAASASYTITAANGGGSTTALVTIAVISAGPTFDNAYPGKSLGELAPNGLSYLMNYAFGGNSTNAPKLPVQDMTDPTKLTLYAFVRTNDSTVTVVGETAATLASWDTNNPVAGARTTDQTGAPEGTERRAFTVNASGDRLFLRLKATK